ncbi:MAG TPA: hypothetical protein VGJ59_00080 [Jatrophihabitantaceae bacterium]|jgi:hypothetical protein
MHHLGIGATHTGKHVLAITDDTTVTVIELDTGAILSSHAIEPNKPAGATNNAAPADGPRSAE